jgi:hypothetical protein
MNLVCLCLLATTWSLVCGERLRSDIPNIATYDGSGLLPAGEGVELTASSALDGPDRRIRRVPGQNGLLIFHESEFIDSVQLVAFFPAAGSERVTVTQADATLDNSLVRSLVESAEGECSSHRTVVGSTLQACSFSNSSWLRASWVVPLENGLCSRDLVLELSGAHPSTIFCLATALLRPTVWHLVPGSRRVQRCICTVMTAPCASWHVCPFQNHCKRLLCRRQWSTNLADRQRHLARSQARV